MKLVPLIGYTKVDAEETRYTGNWDDRVTKLWALVSYWCEKPRSHIYENGKRVPVGPQEVEQVTAEFCIKTAAIADFCGGMWFASPQITFYQRGQWGVDGFCNPGNCNSIDCSWGAWHDDRAIDLEEFTGKKVWTAEEITKYGRECIAMANVSMLISRGTNGWVCSDYVGGSMDEIHKLMCSYTDRAVPMGQAVSLAVVNKETKGHETPKWLNTYETTCTDHKNPEFHNTNSGNNVCIMTGSVEGEHRDEEDCCGEVECPNCERYHDLGCCNACHECGYEFCENYGRNEGERYDLGGQVGRALSNALYLQQARRYDWSNG